MEVSKQSINAKQELILIISMITVLVVSSVIFVCQMRYSLMHEATDKMKDVVDISWQIIMDYKSDADMGSMSKKEAQGLALSTISQLRYNDNTNYVWVNDYNVKMLVNPTRAAGENCADVVDPDGVAFYKNLTEDAKKDGIAYAQYKWIKAGKEKDKFYPKSSVARNVPGWNWIVATGVYTDEIDNLLQRTILIVCVVNLVLALLMKSIVKYVKHIVPHKKHKED